MRKLVLVLSLIITCLLLNLSYSFAANNYTAFTLDELSKYNGQNGNPAYVGLNGYVYDITNEKAFQNGIHKYCMQAVAGTDVTKYMKLAPRNHQKSNFMNRYPIVGVLSSSQSGTKSINQPNNSVSQAASNAQSDSLINRDIVISTGWIVLSIAVIIAFLSQMLNYFKQFIKYSDTEHKKTFAALYKKLLNIHCYLGLASLLLLPIHVYNNLPNIRITVGWVMLLVYTIIIITGIFKKYFKVKFASFRYWHGGLSIIFIILTIIHIFQKLF